MTLTTWLAFLLAGSVIAISPGSGAVLSMSHGLAYGVRRSSATIFGLQAGLLVILFIAGAGVGSILLASSVAFNLVKICGALYLIYLGVSQWRARIIIPADTSAADAAAVDAQAQLHVPSVRKRFVTGFFTNVSNPKGIIFMVAILPQFINAHAALLPQLLILAVSMCCIDLMVMHGYAFAASTMQGYFRNAAAMKKQNRFFGGILMAVGVGLFFVKRSV